ncbi:MAG: hypothetical protein HZA15_02520 [Nitrospirae bacterium]|nr:hypothetical protein [Nitrospirota bacterium]
MTATISPDQSNSVMRVTGVLIMIAVGLTVFLPLTVSISVTAESDVNCIISLDVCHAPDDFGPTNADISAYTENSFTSVHPESKRCIEPGNVSALSFDVPFRHDRPPQP